MFEQASRTSMHMQSNTEIRNVVIQTGFKPGHKRSGSDVIDSLSEDSVFQEGRNGSSQTRGESMSLSTNSQPPRRKSSDIVDCGDVENKGVCTQVDGPTVRPTMLETEAEQKQRHGDWKMSKASSRDLLDASPMSPPETTGASVSDISSHSNEAYMPVDMDDNEYNMQHKYRGYAVIFNHDKFDSTHPPREGSKHDVINLSNTFSSLGFTVIVHDNPDYFEIKDIISKLAQEDHSDNDCLTVTVLTHGDKGGLVPRDGNIIYNVETLWNPFTSDKCPTLAGKPKLFFIQACRGKKIDPGTLLRRDEFDSSPSSYSIPNHADFLIAYSTMEGFYSFRNLDTGTWFIQSLCRELNTRDNLLQILTKTTRRVSQLESDSDFPEFNKRKQVPSITSMLTRDLYFRPKV